MSWAVEYMGPRPKHLDCWGLVRRIYRRELGIDLPSFDYGDPGSELARETISREMETWKQWKQVENPEEFDVALFWEDHVETPEHVGVMVSPRQFIHAQSALISAPPLFHPVWKPRLVGFYRYED